MGRLSFLLNVSLALAFISFIRYGYGEVGLIPGIVVLVLTFGLAWLSYRFIEQPARYSRATAKTVFTVQYILPAGAIAGLALAMYIDGYGLRLAVIGIQVQPRSLS
ncbi:MAG: hypothetical protein IPP57_27960 [Candidatus Obscuribacter sp.]|nr:hypothetical protein [Candidatus Obscuribacter sp.]